MKKTLVATLIMGVFAAPVIAANDIKTVTTAPSKEGVKPMATNNSARAGGSVEQRVKRIIAQQLGINESEIKNGYLFTQDLGADSLDTVELVMALEDEFGIKISDTEAEKMLSVQQTVDYVMSHKK